MKNMKSNAGNFTFAKFQTKKRGFLAIIAIIAVIGFSMTACKDASSGGGGSNGRWRIKKYTSYTVTGGEVGSVSYESVYNWITYRYTSDTNYEQKYTIASTTSSNTYHYTRNGQNSTYTSEGTSETYSQTLTSTTVYDSASGLTLQDTSTSTTTINSSGTTSTTSTEYAYNIQLLSDSGGVKTYKYSLSSFISNGTSVDVSTQGYSEYKIQNGRTLERKSFTADGVLSSTTTYTLSDNAVIKAKLGNYSLSSTTQTGSGSTYNSYQTVEVLSDSATELVIRQKTFTNNVLSGQSDYTYEKVN